MLRASHESQRSVPDPDITPVAAGASGRAHRAGSLLTGLALGAGLVLVGPAWAEPPDRSTVPPQPNAAPAAQAVAKDGAAKDGAAKDVKDATPPGQKPRARLLLDKYWTDGAADPKSAAAQGNPAAGAAEPAPREASISRRAGAAGTSATDPSKGANRSARARLPLAPSAAEIEREQAARRAELEGARAASEPPSAPAVAPASTGDRLQQRAVTTPTQDRRWPTASPNTQGAGGSLGPRTLADRKAALQDASGPQQGVIRNRW